MVVFSKGTNAEVWTEDAKDTTGCVATHSCQPWKRPERSVGGRLLPRRKAISKDRNFSELAKEHNDWSRQETTRCDCALSRLAEAQDVSMEQGQERLLTSVSVVLRDHQESHQWFD